ncbi:hypothetical protein D3C76_1156530 [compost metagenome]
MPAASITFFSVVESAPLPLVPRPDRPVQTSLISPVDFTLLSATLRVGASATGVMSILIVPVLPSAWPSVGRN